MDRVVLLRGRNAELKRIRLVIAIAGSLMAFLAWSTPALGAERRCGDLTAVALSDPISGGTPPSLCCRTAQWQQQTIDAGEPNAAVSDVT